MLIEELTPVTDLDKTKYRIHRMLGKHGMNIPCFNGDRIINELFNSGKIKSVVELYKLTEKDFRRVKGVGRQVTAEELYNSLHQNKQTTLPKFISGLGIPAVNSTKATLLAKQFPIFGKLVNADLFELRRVNLLSEQTISNILEYFNDDDNIDFICDLRETIGISW